MTTKKPFVIGLTGSIGMGKSTTAQMFRDLGIAVWDADASVHRLYQKGGAGTRAIATIYPPAIQDGAVSRAALKSWISNDETAIKQIEAVIHPLVAQDRARFLEHNKDDLVVLDIPLLFETGGAQHVDLIAVVSVPGDVQRARVMERHGMTSEQFEFVVGQQMPDHEKRKRADVVISTLTIESARFGVQNLIRDIRKEHQNA